MTDDVFRVLSIDGGGMRGIYSANFLRTLAYRFGKDGKFDLGKSFDLIVGTSTGGILAVALAYGIPLDDIVDLYNTKGKKIFPNPTPISNSTIKKLAQTLKWLFNISWYHRKRGHNQLKTNLSRIFQNKTIKDLYDERKIALCVPSINAITKAPWIFKTPHINLKTRDNLYSLVDVCMATSSAPIIFPIHSTINPQDKTTKQYFVDGGLCLNNPSLVALIEAKEILKQEGKKTKIQIFSLGTCDGSCYDVLNQKSLNKGILGWIGGIKISEIAMSSQSKAYDFMMNFLCGLDPDIEYINLKKYQSTPSAKQAEYISLDGTHSKALEALLTLSENDANGVHSEYCQGKGCEAIKSLFRP